MGGLVSGFAIHRISTHVAPFWVTSRDLGGGGGAVGWKERSDKQHIQPALHQIPLYSNKSHCVSYRVNPYISGKSTVYLILY